MNLTEVTDCLEQALDLLEEVTEQGLNHLDTGQTLMLAEAQVRIAQTKRELTMFVDDEDEPADLYEVEGGTVEVVYDPDRDNGF